MIKLYDPLIQKLNEARIIAKQLKRWKTFKAIEKAFKISGSEHAERKTLLSFNKKEECNEK
jgi:hypothetical protein